MFINRYKKVKKKKIENRTFCIILCIVPNIICTVSPSVSYARTCITDAAAAGERGAEKDLATGKNDGGRRAVRDTLCVCTAVAAVAAAAEKRRRRRRGARCVRPCRGNRYARARWRRQNGDPLKNILMKLLLNQ